MGTPRHVPPYAPVPPAPPNHYYPPHPGAVHVDDWRPFTPDHGDPTVPDFVEIVDEQEPKDKDKDKQNDDAEKKDVPPVEVSLEGWSLQKAPADPDRPVSWSRVIRRNLPYSQKKLAGIIQAQKRSSRPTTTFSSLSSSQQGVINRLIAEKALAEAHPHAEWVVVDVQKDGKWKSFRQLDITKIQVIIKRIDKSPKPATSSKAHHYQPEDVIDLTIPLPAKEKGPDAEDGKGKGKKGGKKKDNHVEEIVDTALPEWHHVYDADGRPYISPPVEQKWHLAARPPPDPRYRTRPNPFETYQTANLPIVHDDYQEPAERSNSKTKRRTRELEGRVEQLEEMVENMYVTERSESPYYDRTRSSRSPNAPHFTPSSTPSPASRTRDISHRRQSSDGRSRRDPRYDRRHRDERVEVQPAITYRGEREREREPSYRYQERRRITHLEQPHDDYPLARRGSREQTPDWEGRHDPLGRVLQPAKRTSRDRGESQWRTQRWSLFDNPYHR